MFTKFLIKMTCSVPHASGFVSMIHRPVAVETEITDDSDLVRISVHHTPIISF